VILDLFIEDGRIVGFSALFRCLCNPLGINVEDPVLEIVGLDSESRLVLGEFPKHAKRSRGVLRSRSLRV
jgi:hypothetical protein